MVEEAVWGWGRILPFLLSFSVNIKLLFKKSTFKIYMLYIILTCNQDKIFLSEIFCICFSTQFTLPPFLVYINHTSSAQKPPMASGSHTGQSESRAMAAPSHSGYTCEEKVGVFCFVWKQRQLPNKALNLPSIQIAGSQLLSQIFRSKLPTSALPSPALQRVPLQRFFFDETLSKKDAWNTQEQKGSITPEFAEKTALILGVLLINKRRKGFQVLYTVQKKKNLLKCRADLNATQKIRT